MSYLSAADSGYESGGETETDAAALPRESPGVSVWGGPGGAGVSSPPGFAAASRSLGLSGRHGQAVLLPRDHRAGHHHHHYHHQQQQEQQEQEHPKHDKHAKAQPGVLSANETDAADADVSSDQGSVASASPSPSPSPSQSSALPGTEDDGAHTTTGHLGDDEAGGGGADVEGQLDAELEQLESDSSSSDDDDSMRDEPAPLPSHAELSAAMGETGGGHTTAAEGDDEFGSSDDDDTPGLTSRFGPLTLDEKPFGESELQPLPAPLAEDEPVMPAAKVMSIQPAIGSVVASSLPGSGIGVLDQESVLCLEDRTLLGRVDEVFGPVAAPFYTVRVLNEECAEGSAKAVAVGTLLYSIPSLAVVVDKKKLNTKGTDASDFYNHELPEEEQEFSDDEEERRIRGASKRRGGKQRQKAESSSAPHGGAEPRQRRRGHHASSRGARGAGAKVPRVHGGAQPVHSAAPYQLPQSGQSEGAYAAGAFSHPQFIPPPNAAVWAASLLPHAPNAPHARCECICKPRNDAVRRAHAGAAVHARRACRLGRGCNCVHCQCAAAAATTTTTPPTTGAGAAATGS